MWITLWLTLLLILLSACEHGRIDYPQRNVDLTVLQSSTNIVAGEQIFRQNCVQCHGKVSEGRSPKATRFVPPSPDFISSDYQKIDSAYLFWRIETGKQEEPFYSQGSVMPAWRVHFTDDQIWQLVAYIRSRSVHL